MQDGRYSLEFEQEVAEYETGNPDDRSTKVVLELYTKLEHFRSFFDFCERYFSLSGKKFLEIGCGTALISVAAAERGATIFATDFVEKPLRLAAKRFEEHGIRATLFQSDLRDRASCKLYGSFDVVFCFQVVEHIPRQYQFKALANLFDLVAPGGFLFIDTENSLCPYDRHDTNTWLLRLLSKNTYEPLLQALGKGLNFFEPSVGKHVQTRDYLSYDELFGAASITGFEVINPTMPHDDMRTYLRVLTGSDWLYDSIAKYFDFERFCPISILLKKEQ